MSAVIRGVCRRLPGLTLLSHSRTYCVTSSNEPHTEGEQHIINKLKMAFPKASYINVRDTGGGCGTMYSIQIEAEEFVGKRLVAQHRMVNEAVDEELKTIHGLTIETQAPKPTGS